MPLGNGTLWELKCVSHALSQVIDFFKKNLPHSWSLEIRVIAKVSYTIQGCNKLSPSNALLFSNETERNSFGEEVAKEHSLMHIRDCRKGPHGN